MREHLDRRAAQARAVDDARVVQLVRDDDVVAAENRRDGAGVGGEAALKDDRRFGALEFGELALELHVDLHRAGDRSDRARADAERRDRLERALPQLRVRRQTEVVVRRQVDDRAAVDRGARLLLVVEHAQPAIEALVAQRLELGREIAERILAHRASIGVARCSAEEQDQRPGGDGGGR